ncbi:MAG: hypothetical protein ACJ769_04500 [Chloroflexota bacterium]
MRANVGRMALTLVLGASLVAGCGSGSTHPGQQAAAAATPSATVLPSDAPIPAAFRGVWTTGLSGGGESHGLWKLRITPDEMELLNPVAESELDYFPLHATGATPEGVSFAADADCEPASYRWVLAGDTLTLTVVGTDSCTDRQDTLTGAAWHRTK